ncbi:MULTISPECIES: PrgI family protein [Bacillus]|uniref:PrgI family protein n=1 Tax=Bacillus cereus TaxID=1396 RepID=A0A9X6B901_BACCE|nr:MULTISPECIES: PrgI family protein [Bacillus cereus group]MBG9522354.1 conjugative transposon membrane protein [Bacillus thuringiensis]MCQ6287861.1 PrgI family protein [Bacillus cereus]MCQ6315966.1 PrgI family protein [Bacillus cereus]MCQ6327842.1 PrgI family protein [Bacillus cereus]MCQ6339926.1 PrgI family protein [Bacillus cereus]
MNNNFVVSIPKELKHIKSKLFFGLTKRQLIGFSITLAVGLPVFFILKKVSVDVALFGLFLTASPVLFATIFTKDGMPAETWLKLYVEYTFLNPRKRTFQVSKRNAIVAKERNMLNEKRKIRTSKPVSNVAKTR